VVGRRISIVIGCAFHVAGLYLYLVSHQYWHFILAETLEGFGDTFGNGPIDAWRLTRSTRRDLAELRTRFSRDSFRSCA
jgi:hypothetical protein